MKQAILGVILIIAGLIGWYIAGPQGPYLLFCTISGVGIFVFGYADIANQYYRNSTQKTDTDGLFIKKFALTDVIDESESIINCSVEIGNQIAITVEGYGDHCSQDGQGCIAQIENHEGKLMLYVWDDINVEDPTIISLEKARESNRR